MRRIALVIVLLVMALCLLASGTSRDAVKVYFAVEIGGGPASQIWRCNPDGSEPELLHEDNDLGELAIDSEAERMFFNAGYAGYTADLDCSIVQGFHYIDDPAASTTNHLDAKSHYHCIGDGALVVTGLHDPPDDVGYFLLTDIPGMPAGPRVTGVALHVYEGSPVQSTTWGRIKSAYR
jgi:hypothetical protein